MDKSFCLAKCYAKMCGHVLSVPTFTSAIHAHNCKNNNKKIGLRLNKEVKIGMHIIFYSLSSGWETTGTAMFWNQSWECHLPHMMTNILDESGCMSEDTSCLSFTALASPHTRQWRVGLQCPLIWIAAIEALKTMYTQQFKTTSSHCWDKVRFLIT